MDRKPLTTEELHEIGVRNRGNEDVKALLWEIKRLMDANTALSQSEYTLASRAYQLVRMLKESSRGIGGGLGMVMNDLERLLAEHEAKKYQDSIREDISGKSFRAGPMDEDLPDPD